MRYSGCEQMAESNSGKRVVPKPPAKRNTLPIRLVTLIWCSRKVYAVA